MSWPSTTSTPPIRRPARARGTCFRGGRSSARRRIGPQVRAYRGPLGERVVVTGRIGDLLRYKQTLTLWHDVARVECRTTIDEFTGADRLLRLRWPCPVPGALPVSEVGDAVIGRGFGLMHEGGGESAVDSAIHPWTLDNPAYGWFGLSSAVRVRVGSADARQGVRAVSVAEVVTPTESASAPLARPLMVALARAGVTATCSGADHPRYGDLAVDSNLPDARIALGGPDQNAFTAAVLAQADPVYAEELERQLSSTGHARVWVPPGAPLADEWVPGADLRRVRALPVLVIAGSDLRGRGGHPSSRTSPTSRSSSTRRRQLELEPFESYTVAVLNRGMPGFAVDSDGTLHISLMRSCTGWPSGTWIDPPQRTAPDGSNFQLQHWTHTFEYAVVSGDGDWRQARHTGAQCGVLATAAGRHRKQQRRRRFAGVGIAAGDRARGHGATRGAEGGGQPAGRWQRPTRASVRRRRGAARRNIRRHRRCRGPLGTAPGVGVRTRRPPRTAPCAEPFVRGAHAAWVRDRHGADPAEPAAGSGRRPHRAGARRRGRATAVRAVLAAQPWPGAARWTARGRPSASAARSPPSRIPKCGCGLRRPATAATPCCTAGCGCCARRAGRPIPRSSRSCCPRASTWRPTCC